MRSKSVFNAPLKKPAMSGTEAMLKSLGLGEVIEAAKMFANANTMQKIMAFADEVGEINARLKRIEDRLSAGSGPDACRDHPSEPAPSTDGTD